MCLTVMALESRAVAESPATVDYNRMIRPILSQHCFKCHGPDAAERKSGLRLHQAEGATHAAESGGVAIVLFSAVYFWMLSHQSLIYARYALPLLPAFCLGIGLVPSLTSSIFSGQGGQSLLSSVPRMIRLR